ncbi:MAG: EAL domain-containing protein [Acidiferrobacter sp.]
MNTPPGPAGPLLSGAGNLPARIAGLVFWGMVAIGLAAAVVVLHAERQARLAGFRAESAPLVRRIAAAVGNTRIARTTDRAALAQELRVLRADYGFQGLMIVGAHHHFRYGDTRSHAWVVRAMLPGHRALRLYFPRPPAAAWAHRNNVMLAIGLIMMVFGLLLQAALKRMLSRPFASMVAAARRFGDGDHDARMDETLQDEFGFLATFINRALDAGASQQAQLRAALARAAQSETALAVARDRAELALYSITDAIITMDVGGLIQYMNPVAERLTGWGRADAIGLPLDTIMPLVDQQSGQPLANPALAGLAGSPPPAVQDAALRRRDGRTIAVDLSAAPMHDEHGATMGAVLVFQDASRARRLARQLAYQASHDVLTGLFNRRHFEAALNGLLEAAQAEPAVHALLYIDMDQFKIVNDTCGHVAGDELLRQVAAVLRNGLRRTDILARLGGDEFGVLLADSALVEATRIAEDLRERIRGFRFVWQDKVFVIGASIGVVSVSPDIGDGSAILTAADLSCYAAKDLGRNRVHVYRPSDTVLAQRQNDMVLTNLIQEALKNHDLCLYRQPLQWIGLNDRNLDCCEVLVRLRAADGTLMMPEAFMPAAERYGLMPAIDRWVIEHTFASLAAEGSRAPGARHGLVAINLSGASLADEGLLAFIQSTGTDYGIVFKGLCFEITETVAISNWPLAERLIQELKVLGCSIALDDFGSGVSSFGYLKNLPVDFLKIDGGFVQNMTRNPIDRVIVEAINRIGHTLNMITVAEWVEDEETLTMLRAIGIDVVQGNHIGRPVEMPTPVLTPVSAAPATAR